MSRGPFRLLRDLAALSGGEAIAKVAGFVAFAFLSRVLGAPAYGAAELAVALVTLASLIVDFGFGPVAAAELTRDRGRARFLAARVPAARSFLAFGAFGLVVVASILLNPAPETRHLIWVFGLSLFLQPWTQNWLFQGLGLMAWVAPAQAIRMLCLAVGFVVFVSGPDGLWKVGAVEVGAVAAMVLYYLIAQTQHAIPVKLTFDIPYFKVLFREALPISTSQLLWAFSLYIPTVLVAALVAGSEVAWFGSSLRIVVSLNTFVWLYFFNLYPTLVETAGQPYGRFSRLTRRSFRVTAWVGMLCGLLGTIAAEPLCRLAYGTEFGKAGPTFAVLVWVLPISLLSGHARFSLIAYGFQGRELASAAAGSIATVGSVLVLVPRYGAVGAAIAMVGAALLVWLVAHRFAVRCIGPLPFLFPLWRPALAALGAVTGAFWLPTHSTWIRGLAAAAVYVSLAPIVDSSLRQDMYKLRRLRDRGGEGANSSGGHP